jgi:hypothetical protein
MMFHLIGLQTASSMSPQDKSKLTDDPWAFTFALVAAIGNTATAGALYFVYRQSRMTQQEFTSTLRPWVGFSSLIHNNKDSEVDCEKYTKF